MVVQVTLSTSGGFESFLSWRSFIVIPPSLDFYNHPIIFSSKTYMFSIFPKNPHGSNDIPLSVKYLFQYLHLESLRNSLHISHSLNATLADHFLYLSNVFSFLNGANFFTRIQQSLLLERIAFMISR